MLHCAEFCVGEISAFTMENIRKELTEFMSNVKESNETEDKRADFYFGKQHFAHKSVSDVMEALIGVYLKVRSKMLICVPMLLLFNIHVIWFSDDGNTGSLRRYKIFRYSGPRRIRPSFSEEGAVTGASQLYCVRRTDFP